VVDDEKGVRLLELSGTCAVSAPSHDSCSEDARSDVDTVLGAEAENISYLISGHPTDHVINGNVSFVVVPLLLLS
jgi:hypothetical protein